MSKQANERKNKKGKKGKSEEKRKGKKDQKDNKERRRNESDSSHSEDIEALRTRSGNKDKHPEKEQKVEKREETDKKRKHDGETERKASRGEISAKDKKKDKISKDKDAKKERLESENFNRVVDSTITLRRSKMTEQNETYLKEEKKGETDLKQPEEIPEKSKISDTDDGYNSSSSSVMESTQEVEIEKSEPQDSSAWKIDQMCKTPYCNEYRHVVVTKKFCNCTKSYCHRHWDPDNHGCSLAKT